MRFLPSLARVAVASTLISLLGTQPMWGWGMDGHMMINHLAAQFLPEDVPAFVRNPNGIDVQEWLGPEPDRWRNRAEDELSQTQAADHFIDLEWADMAGAYPKRRYDFVRALNRAQTDHPEIPLTPEKVGMLPWQTQEVWQRLKVDFREYRHLAAAHADTAPVQTAILFEAGLLGHYVGDGSMPLHTTIQYNGWTGANPNGYTTDHRIHALFESGFVSANVKRAEVAPLIASTKPQVIAEEWPQFLEYLRHTHTLMERTYQLEKTGAFRGAGTPEGKAFVEERLAAGAIELRDMIYSAWVHSGDPVEEFHDRAAPKAAAN